MRLGWTREALAYHSGVSWSAISQIESGRRRNARLATLTALSRALGVTVDYLVGETSPPTMLSHRLFAYGSDDEFASGTIPFLEASLGRSEAILVVATADHIGVMRDGLGRDARNVEFADNGEWYTSPLDAAGAYGAFAADKLASGHSWVNIVGEIEFGKQDRDEVAVWTTYESIFNVMFANSPLTALCMYDTRSSGDLLMKMVMDTHPQLATDNTTAPNDRFRDPEQVLLAGR